MLGYFDSASSTSTDKMSTSSCSPASSSRGSPSASSSRSFGGASHGGAKARLQDKQIEKGTSIMMRDYIPTHINIMLYGESGLGKTTCIKNLIGSWEIEKMGAAFEKTGRTSLQMFRADPENLKIKLKPLRSPEANRDLLLTFQDMPGWGDDINLVNSLRTVVSYLLKQRQKDFHAQDGGFPVNGAATHRGALQHAVTVCLYFVPPHRIKPVDWIMMAAISKLTAVVPVIAKADTFTAKEMEDFKQEIMQVIHAAANKGPGRIETPVMPRTSGCGAATTEGLQSTKSANQKPAPMSPAVAAAKMQQGSTSPKATTPTTDITATATAATATTGKATTAKSKLGKAVERLTAGAAADKTPSAGGAAPAAAAAATTDKKTTDAKAPAAAAPAAPAPAAAAPAPAAPAKVATAAPTATPAATTTAAATGPVVEEVLRATIDLARDLGLETYTFSQDALDAIDADASQLPPFAVVGSPDLLPLHAPETDGICCPQGQTSLLPRELWPCAGEPYRRYPWGTAFPLNRSHSDLIILKQLLTGHCNTAIYDLLDDSWRRAVNFAEKYRKLLLSKAHDSVKDLLDAPGLMDPMTEEVCSNGRLVPLQDRLRDEEQKKLQAELERAALRLRELEDTVKTQRRALSSMQQQLSTVLQEKTQTRFGKLLRGKA